MQLTEKDMKSKQEPDRTAKETNSKPQKEKTVITENKLELAGLTLREKLRYQKQQYKNQIQEMSAKERFFYTIGYYKWYFLGFCLILFLLGWGIRTAYRATWPTELYLAIVNNETLNSPADYIKETYRSYYQLDDKNFFRVYPEMYITPDEDIQQIGTTMNDYQKIGYYNMYDMLDVIIVDEKALKVYASSDDTTAIDLSMEPDLYQQLSDYVVMLTDPNGIKNEGKPYAGALDITNTDFKKGCGLTYEKAYLLIPSTKYTDNDRTIRFIKMIYNIP